jgi:hypothetical protein
MRVALTGATGFIGSHVLTELNGHGHEVTALLPDESRADVVANRGATPVVIDLYDRSAVTNLLGDEEGASILPVPVTRPAQTWTRRWSMQRSRRSQAPARPTFTSAGHGSTGTIPLSTRTPRLFRPGLWPGRNRSSAGYLAPEECVESSSCPASHTVMTAEGSPGSFSARHETSGAI